MKFKKRKPIEKISDTESWFFEKANEADILLVRMIKNKEMTPVSGLIEETSAHTL